VSDDEFSLKNLQITEPLPAPDSVAAKPRRRSREFVMVSREQADRLAKATHFAAERVFLHLLFLTWRFPNRPVRLGNVGLADKGVDRYTKRRVLRELETLGLIRVEWRPKKSPIVTIVGAGAR
jgi:hypothetical protein